MAQQAARGACEAARTLGRLEMPGCARRLRGGPQQRQEPIDKRFTACRLRPATGGRGASQ